MSETEIALPLWKGNSNEKASAILVYPSDLPGRCSEVIALLEKEQCPPITWRTVAVEYYRQQLYEDFEAVLNRSIEISSTYLLNKDDDGVVPLHSNDQCSLGLQHIELCLALAAFQIYKTLTGHVRTHVVGSDPLSPTSKARTTSELSIRQAEELLKRAELLLNTTSSSSSILLGTELQSTITSPTRTNHYGGGRGAQLAAAARLMLSTSSCSTSSSYPSSSSSPSAKLGAGGSSTQQEQHVLDKVVSSNEYCPLSQQHSLLLSSSSLTQQNQHRLMLSPLLGYGYLYLAQASTFDSAESSEHVDALTRAQNTFRVVLNAQPDSILAQLGLAAASFMSRNYLAAIKLYSSVMRTCPKAPTNIRLGLGLCHFYLGGHEKAVKAFQRVLQLDPDNPDALSALAILKLCKALPSALHISDDNQRKELLTKRVHSAISLITTALKKDPTHPLALLGLAQAAFLGDAPSSMVDKLLLKTNIATGSGRSPSAEWWYQKGRLHHVKGHFNKAAQDYLQSLQYDPRWLSARFCLTQTYVILGHLQEAETHLQILARSSPNNPDILKLLAYTCIRLGEKCCFESNITQEEGVSSQNGIINSSGTLNYNATNNNDLEAREKKFNEGEGYFNVASKCCKILLDFSFEDKEVLLLFVRANMFRFQHGQACVLKDLISAYETLLQIDSLLDRYENKNKEDISSECVVVELINNLGTLYAVSGQYKKAIQLFSLCLNISRITSNQKYEMSSNHHVNDKSLTEEEQTWQEAQSATIRFNLALTLELMGDHKGANAAYKRLNADIPGYTDPWHRRCWMSLNRQNLAAAKAQCEQATQHRIEPKEMSEIYKLQGRWERALQVVHQATSQGIDDTYVHAALGCLHYQIAQIYRTKKTKESFTMSSSIDSTQFISQATKHYKESLRIDPTNWYAANGLAVIMAEQNSTTAAIDAFTGLLDACTSAYRVRNEKADTEEPLAETDHTIHVFGRYVEMEATAHANLGLLYLSQAMKENPAVIPGKDVALLDSKKIAKALKHYLTALSLRPLSKSIHLQLARLYHDCCRFREGQAILENACLKWPESILFRHNLARMIEKAIMSEMQVDQLISNPRCVRGWISECKVVESFHDINLKLLKAITPLSPLNAKVLRDHLIVSHTFPTFSGDQNEALMQWHHLYGGVPLPPEDIELLPSTDLIISCKEQIAHVLCTGLQETLPSVEEEWKKHHTEVANLRAKNEALRQKREEERTLQAQIDLEDESRKQQAADTQLLEEAEEIARSLVRRDTERSKRGKATVVDKAFLNDDEGAHSAEDSYSEDDSHSRTESLFDKTEEHNGKHKRFKRDRLDSDSDRKKRKQKKKRKTRRKPHNSELQEDNDTDYIVNDNDDDDDDDDTTTTDATEIALKKLLRLRKKSSNNDDTLADGSLDSEINQTQHNKLRKPDLSDDSESSKRQSPAPPSDNSAEDNEDVDDNFFTDVMEN